MFIRYRVNNEIVDLYPPSEDEDLVKSLTDDDQFTYNYIRKLAEGEQINISGHIVTISRFINPIEEEIIFDGRAMDDELDPHENIPAMTEPNYTSMAESGNCDEEDLRAAQRKLSAREVLLLNELLSSSSESEEEEDISVLTERNKKTKSTNFLELVYQFTEKEFKSHFRLEKRTAYAIIEHYEASPFYPSEKNHGGSQPLSAEHDFLTFLWFAGNKVSLRDVSLRFGVSCSTTFYQVSRTMEFLLDIAPNIIRFPEDKEQEAINFRNIAQFPDIIGCIDGTSITIRTPAHKIKSTYVNRHDIPSLTLQAVCDSRKRFIDTSVGAPSKIHDARVFKLSDLSSELPQICGKKYHLLGDSAYAIREWLLVPYKDYGNLSYGQKFFNKRFCATRVLIENSFGLLKGRFRQLSEIHMKSVDKISKFITSCCVLHNLCIDFHDNFVCYRRLDNLEYPNYEIDKSDQHLKRLGEVKRDALMRQFSRNNSSSESEAPTANPIL